MAEDSEYMTFCAIGNCRMIILYRVCETTSCSPFFEEIVHKIYGTNK